MFFVFLSIYHKPTCSGVFHQDHEVKKNINNIFIHKKKQKQQAINKNNNNKKCNCRQKININFFLSLLLYSAVSTINYVIRL